LPFVYAIVGAAFVATLCEVIARLLAPSYPKTSGINFATMSLPFIQIIGGFLAGAILIFGLVGAVGRWFERRGSASRLDEQSGIESIRRLSWQEFERLLGEFYRLQGYEVRQRGGPVADGGADLELHRGDEKLLVQAKHWKTWVVKLPQLRELWGAVADEHADGAILVTSGSFSNDARRWTEGKNLALIDGRQLAAAVASIQRGSASASEKSGREARVCPACGRLMVERIAKRGSMSGQTFWGCSGFPQCRHTEVYSASITTSH
jgi:restriction system protein